MTVIVCVGLLAPLGWSKEAQNDYGGYFPLNLFLVNLADAGGKKYLKTKIALELSGEMALEEIIRRKVMIRDVILMHLSSKTFEDINTVDGKIELRNELVMRLNQSLHGAAIRKIYFTEFVIQ